MREVRMRVYVLGMVAIAVVFGSALVRAEGWESSLNAAVQLTDGNSDTLALQVGASTTKSAGKHECLSGVTFSYGESEDEKNVENLASHVQHNWFLNERLYVHTKLEAGYDDVADVDYRVFVGLPGLGYYLLSTDRTKLAVELSYAHLWEKVGGELRDVPSLRATQRFEHKLSETAKVWESVDYLPELKDFDQYLLLAEAGVEAMLNAHVSLRVVLTDTYDSDPAGGRENNDLALHAGVGVRL